MSQGTLYIMEISPRSSILVDLIKYFKLDIEIDANTQSESFIKKFPLGKTPAFVGAKGFQLTETIAIANYFLSLIPNQKLLGKTIKNMLILLNMFFIESRRCYFLGCSLFQIKW